MKPVESTSRTAGPATTTIRPQTSLRSPAGAVLVAGIVALTAAATLTPLASNDIWVHLAVGRSTVAGLLSGEGIPREETFSFTAGGRALVPHEWLAAVFFYGAHRAAGAAGVQALRLVLALATLAALAAAARTAGATAGGIGWALVLLVPSIAPRLVERPHLFSFALGAALLALLARESVGKGRATSWLAIPLMIVWANLHGGFIVGFVLLGAFIAALLVASIRPGGDTAARTRAARLGGVAAASLAAVAWLNPSGPALLAFPVRMITSPTITGGIYEWRSPLTTAYLTSTPFLLTVVWAALLARLAWVTRASGPRRPPGWAVAGAVLFVLFGGLALRQIRSLSDFVVMTFPWMAVCLGGWLSRREASRRIPAPAAAGIAAAGAALLIAAFGYPLWPATRTRCIPPLVADWVPVTATDQIAKMTWLPQPARLFNSYNLGGYLAWRLGDRHRILIDSRNEAYGDVLTREILDGFHDPGAFDRLVSRWPPDLLVLSWRGIAGSPVLVRVQHSPDWSLRFLDDHVAVYAGSGAPGRPLGFISPLGYGPREITPETAPEALEEGSRLDGWSPGGVMAALVTGKAHLASGHPDRAVASIELALGRSRVPSPILWELLSEARGAAGDPAGAAEAARRAAEFLSPTVP